MHQEEYESVLRAIEEALAICERSQTADDVVRLRLRHQLRDLQLGLLCVLQREDEAGKQDQPRWSPPIGAAG
jgi:hypothetical protein